MGTYRGAVGIKHRITNGNVGVDVGNLSSYNVNRPTKLQAAHKSYQDKNGEPKHMMAGSGIEKLTLLAAFCRNTEFVMVARPCTCMAPPPGAELPLSCRLRRKMQLFTVADAPKAT